MILCRTPSKHILCHYRLGESIYAKSYQYDIIGRRFDINLGQEEAAVEKILEELAREIHTSVGVKMHRLGVCEWEVKLCIKAAGEANGAWRVVVTNATGHTCVVHVSQFLVYLVVKGWYSISVTKPMVFCNGTIKAVFIFESKNSKSLTIVDYR